MLIKLKKFGTILTSRQLGKEALLAFRPTLKNVSTKEGVEIDFEGISVLSPSWADEFFTPLAREYKENLVLNKTDNASVEATLEFLEEVNELNFNFK